MPDYTPTTIGEGRLPGADDGEEEDEDEDRVDEDNGDEDEDDDDDEEMEDVTAGIGGGGMASGDRSTITMKAEGGSNNESTKRKVDELDDEYD
jgi:hypothetical protein